MKRIFFGRKKLKKSQSVQNDRINVSDGRIVNGGTNVPSSGASDQPITRTSKESTLDDCHSCFNATTSSLMEEHHFDEELDKHMMQTISDIKYNKRPKYVAVGEVNFQRESLDAHNLVRTRYGCQSLLWSQELSDLAHTWAVKLSATGRVLFPELPGIGENIFLSMTTGQSHLPSGTEITEIWANEAEKFNFDAPKWHPNCQHFTQIVWKETYEMGIARHWNINKNCVVIVAFYRPGGNSNAPGEFRINVPSKACFDDNPVSIATPLAFTASAIGRSVNTFNSGLGSSDKS